MAKILIIDTDGVGLSFGWRCVQAGHEVKWFLANKPSISKETGSGFRGMTKVPNWVPHVMWADLIFPVSNDMFVERLDFFRKRGAKVFGPTAASAALEIKRAEGMEVLEAAGIETAPYKTFKSVLDARKHVEKTGERFVFKTLGDNEDKALTYVSKHAADMLNWMDGLKKEPEGDVMLQTFIDGIEMGVSRFMGRDGWVGQWNESFEHKKLMAGNYGPNTGEMGTVAAFTKESKLGEETLGKLEKVLLDRGHTGDTALGFIIDADGKPWPTEWTCRFGWPIENMMLGATEGDPAQWMIDALNGKDTTSFKEDIGCCLVLAHKDFPHGQATKAEVSGSPIYGVTKGNRKHLHPQNVKLDVAFDMDKGKLTRRPIWASSGDYLLVITGFGDSVRQATGRAYKTAKQLHVSNPILRDDIGEDLKHQLPTLHGLGYAKHFDYEGNGK